MFSNDDYEKILRNEFCLEFIEATLIQQGEGSSKTYKGSGAITLSQDGQLMLKMYCKLAALDESQYFTFESLSLEPGVIIGVEHYYSFEGVDFRGGLWKAINLHVEENVSFPASGCIVTSKVRQIENRSELSGRRSRNWNTAVVPGKYRIPFNAGQQGTTEPGFSSCKIDLGGGRSCSIHTLKRSIVINVDLQDQDPEQYPARVVEAVGLACGARLLPQVEAIESQGCVRSILRSVNVSARERHRLIPPVQCDISQHQHFANLVRAVVSYRGDCYPQLRRFWHGVLMSSDSGLENEALVLTTAIEGVLKVGFPDEGKPEQSFLDELEDAKQKIRAVKGLAAGARDRLLGALGNARSPTAKKALRALADAGRIDDAMPALWQDLRNKMAHADVLVMTLGQEQDFLDQLHGCMELFYRLIILLVGYRGLVTHYSKRGWPDGLVAPN
jgi:hypothetical protein